MRIIGLFFLFLFFASSYPAEGNPDSLIIENLVFEGAGIRGIAYCGALMELNEKGYLACVDHVGGTSSGSITACLMSIGYSPTEIFEVIGSTDFGKFNDGGMGVFGGISRIRRKLGYYKGKAFLKWMEHLIEEKTRSPNTTFKDLRAMRNSDSSCVYKDLVIAATSLNHQKTIFFSADSYPDMRIVDAVHASMAIPIYFEPVAISPTGHVVDRKTMTHHDNLCVDGGFTANFIIRYFDQISSSGEHTLAPTLGLRLDSDEQILNDTSNKQLAYQKIEDSGDFIAAFFYMIKETLNRQQLSDLDWARSVSISDCGMSPKMKKLSVSEKKILIQAGRTGVRNYLEK